MAGERRIEARPGDPHRRDQRLCFLAREHQGRQIEARAHAVADARLAFDRHALRGEIGDVAVDRALRDLEAIGEEARGAEAPAADQLDELEQAVGAAHALTIGAFAASTLRVQADAVAFAVGDVGEAAHVAGQLDLWGEHAPAGLGQPRQHRVE